MKQEYYKVKSIFMSNPERHLDCLTDCNSACCGDMLITLSDKEHRMLVKKGQLLNKLPDSTQGRLKKRAVYEMRGDCVMLVENKCSLHKKRSQPKACKKNKAGDRFCDYARLMRNQRAHNPNS